MSAFGGQPELLSADRRRQEIKGAEKASTTFRLVPLHRMMDRESASAGRANRFGTPAPSLAEVTTRPSFFPNVPDIAPRAPCDRQPVAAMISSIVAPVIEADGFAATIDLLDYDALQAHKIASGIPEDMASCHTAHVDCYAIEGHVPPADIRRLLAARPDAVGLSVPSMGAKRRGGEPVLAIAVGSARPELWPNAATCIWAR